MKVCPARWRQQPHDRPYGDITRRRLMRRARRRLIAALIMAALSTFALAGCAGGDAGDPPVLRFYEFAASGVPTAASPTPPNPAAIDRFLAAGLDRIGVPGMAGARAPRA